MQTFLLKNTYLKPFKNPSAQLFKSHGRQTPLIIEYLWGGKKIRNQKPISFTGSVITSKTSTIGQNTRALQEKQHYETRTADSERTGTVMYSQGARLALNKLTQVPEVI